MGDWLDGLLQADSTIDQRQRQSAGVIQDNTFHRGFIDKDGTVVYSDRDNSAQILELADFNPSRITPAMYDERMNIEDLGLNPNVQDESARKKPFINGRNINRRKAGKYNDATNFTFH